MNKLLPALGALLAPLFARAHEGHGLPGAAHWHAGDALMVLGVAAIGVVGLWLSRRK